MLSLLYCIHIRGCALFALLCLSVDTRCVPVRIAIFGRSLLVPFLRFDPFHPTISSAWEKMRVSMNAVNRMFFIARWIRAHGEIALLYAEDLTVFIQRRHQFGPHCFRRIADVPYQDCYTWFGHCPHSLCRLHLHLRVPQTFRFSDRQDRHIYGGEECSSFTCII